MITNASTRMPISKTLVVSKTCLASKATNNCMQKFKLEVENLVSGRFRAPRHLLALHVTKPHAASDSGEAVQEAHVDHARHFIIWWQSGSRHTAAELTLCFATCREFDTSECTAAAAQAGRTHLAAKIAFQAQKSFLCRAANVVNFWYAAVVAAAASMMHNDLWLVNGIEIHLSLLWGRHVWLEGVWKSDLLPTDNPTWSKLAAIPFPLVQSAKSTWLFRWFHSNTATVYT